MDETNPWLRNARTIEFDCPFFTVRSDKVTHRDGHAHVYNHLHFGIHGVTVLPIDDLGQTTLIGQFRYPLDRFTWELPRGGSPVGSNPLDGAKAELSQETGYTADHWLQVFDLTMCPGNTDEQAPSYVAWGLHAGTPQPDENETLSQRLVPFGEAIELALSGKITDAASVALILAVHIRTLEGKLPTGLLHLLRARPE